MSAGAFRAGAIGLALATSMTVACDTLLTEPAPSAEVGVTFAPTAEAVVEPGVARAFERIDRVRLHLVRPDSIARDTTVRVTVVGGQVTARLVLQSRERVAALRITAELQAGDKALFTGTVTQPIRLGESLQARIAMSPIPAAVLVPAGGVTLKSIGDSVRLPAAVVFATGDTIVGAQLSWTSSGPGVVEVGRDGRYGIARAPGEALLTARLESLAATLTARVSQVADTVFVTPSSATLRVQESRALTATVVDRNRHPIAGAAVAWTASPASVASVGAAGVVTGVSPGQAVVVARSGTARGAAVVRVDP